jgi:hypothetical protein
MVQSFVSKRIQLGTLRLFTLYTIVVYHFNDIEKKREK